MLHDLFHLGSDVFHMGISAGEKGLRTIGVYLGILILLRVAGKRTLGQLTTFDFVVVLLLSNVVQNAIIGNDQSLTGGLLGAGFLVLVNYAVVFFAFLNPRLDADLRGREVTVVVDGKVDERALRRELLSPAELQAALRRQGYPDISQLREVRLEPDGSLSVTRADDAVTLRDVMEKLTAIEGRLQQHAQ